MKWKNVILHRHLNGGNSVSKRNIAQLYNSKNVVKKSLIPILSPFFSTDFLFVCFLFLPAFLSLWEKLISLSLSLSCLQNTIIPYEKFLAASSVHSELQKGIINTLRKDSVFTSRNLIEKEKRKS